MRYLLDQGVRYRREYFGCALLGPDRTTRFFNQTAAAIFEVFAEPTEIARVAELVAYRGPPADLCAFAESALRSRLLVEAPCAAGGASLFLAPPETLCIDRLASPLGLELELTLKCSRRCTYCAYESSPSVSTAGELSADEWFSVVDAAAGAGVFYVRLTGGDPLLRSDCLDIAEHVSRRGLGLSIASDLTRLSPEAVTRLAELDSLILLQTTLDGSAPVRADAMRGAGNFKRVTAGLRALAAVGVPVLVGTIVTRDNASDVYATAALLASIGRFRYCVSPLYEAGRGRDLSGSVPSSHDLQLAYEQFRAAVADGLVEAGDPAWDPLTAEIPTQNIGEVFCDQPFLVRAPDRLMRIDPSGRCYASIQLKELIGEDVYVGNIRTSSLLDLWRDAPLLQAMRRDADTHALFGSVLDVRELSTKGIPQ